MYHAWQMTGARKYKKELDYRIGVMHSLRLADGSIPEHLDFDKKSYMLRRTKSTGGYLDLTLDYLTNALIDYYADTKDEKSRQVLMGLAERNLKDTPTGPADFMRIDGMRLLAWAYLQTRDKRFLDRAAYHLSSFDAKPLAKWPSSPAGWKRIFGMLRAPRLGRAVRRTRRADGALRDEGRPRGGQGAAVAAARQSGQCTSVVCPGAKARVGPPDSCSTRP